MDDFFVEPNECVFCGAPPVAAPNLMGMRISDTGYEECYFKRQPSGRAEIDEAISGVNASCCGAVQYCGNDKYVLRRISTLSVARLPSGVKSKSAIVPENDRPTLSPAQGFVRRLLERFR